MTSNVNRLDATGCDSQSLLERETAMTIAITRLELTASDLRDAAAQTQDAKASRRMLAIALVLEGWSREAAGEAWRNGSPARLCDWVRRYDEFERGGSVRPAASQRPAAPPVR